MTSNMLKECDSKLSSMVVAVQLVWIGFCLQFNYSNSVVKPVVPTVMGLLSYVLELKS